MKKSVSIIFFIICLAVLGMTLQTRYSNMTLRRQSDTQIISGSFDSQQQLSDAQWKQKLTPRQYAIVRKQGTEIPFTGSLLHESRKGTYYSAGCNQAVFRSEQKFDSGTGWPSFWAPIKPDTVVLRKDTTGQDVRVEVLDVCGGHLGHVFDDGPNPTGKRYCINSDALIFVPDP